MSEAVLDTSVVVRYLVDDDPEKSEVVSELLRSAANGAFLMPNVAVAEMAFVLLRVYHWPRTATADAIRAVVNHRVIVVPARETWLEVADDIDRGWGVIDSYLLRTAQREGIPHVLTFDERMKPIPGVRPVLP